MNKSLTALSIVALLAAGSGLSWWLSSVGAGKAADEVALPGRGFKQAPQKQPEGKPAKNTAAPAPSDNEYATLSFDTLAGYFYLAPDADTLASAAAQERQDQIPAPIKALNGKKVAVLGYMWGTKLEQGGCKEFLLVRDQGICCFARVPRMNEWISITMAGDKLARVVRDQPITVLGTLYVEERVEKGTVIDLYRLTADDVSGAAFDL